MAGLPHTAMHIRHCPSQGDAVYTVIYEVAQSATWTSVCVSSRTLITLILFSAFISYVLTGAGVVGRGGGCGAGRYSITPVYLPRQNYSSWFGLKS